MRARMHATLQLEPALGTLFTYVHGEVWPTQVSTGSSSSPLLVYESTPLLVSAWEAGSTIKHWYCCNNACMAVKFSLKNLIELKTDFNDK